MKPVIGVIALVAVAVLILMGSALGSYGCGNETVLAKTYRPEKEGVTDHRVGDGEMSDSCISPNPHSLSTRGPRPC